MLSVRLYLPQTGPPRASNVETIKTKEEVPTFLCRNHSANPINSALKPIHLGWIAEKAPSRYAEMAVLLTSILESRTCPINLHFAVDVSSQATIQGFLGDLISRKDLHLKVHFHSIDRVQQTLKDLETSFSSRWALYKTSPELVFPSELDDILLLDSDMMVLTDVCPAYYRLQKDVANTCALIAPEYEQWSAYAPNNQHAMLAAPLKPEHEHYDPNVKMYGMNSGTIMSNLAMMRKVNWTDTWMTLVHQSPWSTYPNLLEFGDQNVLNLVAKIYPNLVSSMSFDYNYLAHIAKFGVSLKTHVDDVVIVHGSSGHFRNSDLDFVKHVWWRFMPNVTGRETLMQYHGSHRPEYLRGFAAARQTCYNERVNIRDFIKTSTEYKF
ncbi:nucleotide-diphospho-sugar transferase [Obelidium mucronatum]|nr:nucleotide-diphospho-sugar transferase [Obelidium mucronatum]